MTETHRITWFAPDRPVEGGTIYVRDDQDPDLAEAERRLWALAIGPSAAARWINTLMVEYDRRGAAEQAAQAAVASWRQSGGPANAQGMILSALANALARSTPGAPTPASLVEQDRRATGSLAAAYRRGWREGAGDDQYEGPIIVPDDLAVPVASSPSEAT